MSKESIENTYSFIEATYGREGVSFAGKIIKLFRQSRGRDHILWMNITRLYRTGEIVPFEGLLTQSLEGKILLRHAIQRGFEDYERNALFGFTDRSGTPHFAETPDLYEWDGTVNSIGTALLDLGMSFHSLTVKPEKLSTANNKHLMARALLIANRLSDGIREGKI